MASLPNTGANPRKIADVNAAVMPDECFLCKDTSLYLVSAGKENLYLPCSERPAEALRQLLCSPVAGHLIHQLLYQ
jgi:hypothetical protein